MRSVPDNELFSLRHCHVRAVSKALDLLLAVPGVVVEKLESRLGWPEADHAEHHSFESWIIVLIISFLRAVLLWVVVADAVFRNRLLATIAFENVGAFVDETAKA